MQLTAAQQIAAHRHLAIAHYSIHPPHQAGRVAFTGCSLLHRGQRQRLLSTRRYAGHAARSLLEVASVFAAAL